MKISLKELLKNPANVILVLIFIISIVVGSLFVFRIFYHKDEDVVVAMKELDDTLIYYASNNQTDLNGNPAENIALILDGKNKFNLIINGNLGVGYTGNYIQKDKNILLFSDLSYSSQTKNEYRLFTIVVQEDGSLILSNTINNVTNYVLTKTVSNEMKTKGFNNLSISSDRQIENDKFNIISNGYKLNSIYDVLGYINNINDLYSDNIYSSIYSLNDLNRRNITSNQIISSIFDNTDGTNYDINTLNQIASNIYNVNINPEEISYLGNKYIYTNDKYEKSNDVTGTRFENLYKRIYNYEVIDSKLYVYEIYIAYECMDGACKFYPITDLNNENKNYYDFTTSSLDVSLILANIDKMNHYKWVFSFNDESGYSFEQLIIE